MGAVGEAQLAGTSQCRDFPSALFGV